MDGSGIDVVRRDVRGSGSGYKLQGYAVDEADAGDGDRYGGRAGRSRIGGCAGEHRLDIEIDVVGHGTVGVAHSYLDVDGKCANRSGEDSSEGSGINVSGSERV
jgi:hypothetical protein